MKNKVVAFKEHGKLTPSLIHRLKEAGRQYGLEEILPISAGDIIVAEWVQLKCRYGCTQYNRSWCCPPATPRPEKVRQILAEYSEALLLQSVHYVPEFYRNDKRKRARLVRCWKGTVSVERQLFLEGYYKAFSLVGESCALCKNCVYPKNCRFPQEKRPSLESFSVDVIGTVRSVGLEPQVASDPSDEYTYYAIILVA